MLTNNPTGLVETTGALPMAPADRHSSPLNVIRIFAGGNFWWGAALYGWIIAQFGLGFWDSLVALLAGILVGTLLVAPLGALSYRTGTNAPVASAMFFGNRGRYIGTLLSFIVAIVFTALTVWTSGDALVTSAQRVFDWPSGEAQYAIGYAVVAALVLLVAILGHEVIVNAHKILAPLSGALLVLGAIAFAPSFETQPLTSALLLDGPVATWVMIFAIGFSAPIAYAPVLGDYTRKLTPGKHSTTVVTSTMVVALLIAIWVPFSVGTVIAFSLRGEVAGSFIPDMVAQAPAWYIAPIIIIAIAGGFGQGVMGLYSSGLDLSSVFPRMARAVTTALCGVLAVLVLYLGAFVFEIASYVEAVAILLTCLVAPWAVILVMGGATRNRHFDLAALSALGSSSASRGTYAYSGGWNLPATIAWVAGSTFGLLTVNTQLLTGPFAGILGGIDVSVIGSCLLGCLVYLALRRPDPAFSSDREPVLHGE